MQNFRCRVSDVNILRPVFNACRVEDVPYIFDTMYAARFPDCRRAAAFRDAARGHPSASSPWFTGILAMNESFHYYYPY